MPFASWPAQAEGLRVDEVVNMYDRGFSGVDLDPKRNEDARQDFYQAIKSHGGYIFASDALGQFGLAESGKGELVIPFVFIEKHFPGSMPGPAQGRGDCVSHSTKNACVTTMACEIEAGKPDEVSGKVEGVPDIPDRGVKEGVVSTEAIYWWRRHGGDGWHCSASAKVVCTESGLWLRKNYSDVGIDLTSYSSRLAGKWGRTPPPNNIKGVGQPHLMRTATRCTGFEEIRDLLYNGYGITSCGSEGFDNRRDENGVARRKGSWAHAMAYYGVDDREETKRKYGGPLVLVANSWGSNWIGGPRKIMGTNIQIPEGCFWAKWSDLSRRDCYALSGVNGWPAKKLTHYIKSLLG